MEIQLIRNATLRMTYAGHTFIIDPYLADKHSLPSYAGHSPNPLVDLPMSAKSVIDGVEMVVVSHLHTDHFDQLAQELLPKDLPIVCQFGEETSIKEKGFQHVLPVSEEILWNGITIRRTCGQHGSSQTVLRDMGEVSGFIFEAKGEPTLYWLGDTIWYNEIKKTISQRKPDIIIVHSAGAIWGEDELIVMDGKQTIELCQYASKSIVIATHLEALDHCTVSRKDLRTYAQVNGIENDQLYIPDDGEVLVF